MTTKVLLPALLRTVACALFFFAVLSSTALAQNQITLPDGTAGQPYGPVQLTAQGAKGPITWAAQPASTPLPDGVTSPLPKGVELIPATGTLQGKPSEAGDYTFLLVVTDNNDHSVKGEQRFRMRVNDALR